MASLLGLAYDSDSDSSDGGEEAKDSPAPSIDSNRKHEYTAHLKPMKRGRPVGGGIGGSVVVCANPEVEIAESVTDLIPIAPDAKEVKYNPKYEELFTPTVGPDNPLKTQQAKADKNTAAGEWRPVCKSILLVRESIMNSLQLVRSSVYLYFVLLFNYNNEFCCTSFTHTPICRFCGAGSLQRLSFRESNADFPFLRASY